MMTKRLESLVTGGVLLFAFLYCVHQQSAQAARAQELFHLIRVNDIATLEKLSINAAVVNVSDGGDLTPLHYAALYGSAAAVRLLLDKGADPNARTLHDLTPLMCASSSPTKTQLLLAHGAERTTPIELERTALLITPAFSPF